MAVGTMTKCDGESLKKVLVKCLCSTLSFTFLLCLKLPFTCESHYDKAARCTHGRSQHRTGDVVIMKGIKCAE